jgi:hypothetical protein
VVRCCAEQGREPGEGDDADRWARSVSERGGRGRWSCAANGLNGPSELAGSLGEKEVGGLRLGEWTGEKSRAGRGNSGPKREREGFGNGFWVFF